LEAEKARALVVIPPGFQKDVLSNRLANIQVLIDGADNSAVSSISGYLGEIRARTARNLLGVRLAPPVELKTRFLFNPELNSQWFVVPGLVVVVMAILSVLLTALTVAREWESGSMELLLSTPVRPIEIILGKLAPYAVLGLGGVALVYTLARLGFGVPFRGSHFLFLLGSVLFLATYLSQGLLISVLTRRQQLATQIAMLSGLLPSMLLSGFVFPVDNMPLFFRYFTMLLPARWFMNIARDSFLKGSTFWDLRHSYFALFVLAIVFVSVAAKKFKKDVEP
jgi:ABC-2 type transport system permease protein